MPKNPDVQHDVAEFAQILAAAISHISIHLQTRILTAEGVDTADDDTTYVLGLGFVSTRACQLSCLCGFT